MAKQGPNSPVFGGETADVADTARQNTVNGGLRSGHAGERSIMSDQSNLNDDDIESNGPTEADENRDAGGEGPRDTGDEPTEKDDDRDAGGEGTSDTGDV